MRLSGRVALVTGAQQGIGRAIAIALGCDGANVCVNFLDDREAAERVAAEIRSLGRKAMVVPGDVARSQDVAAILAAATADLGTPDILVNNAGVFPRAQFLELAESEWDHVLGVNLKGGFLCAQAVARAMVAAGKPGAIINISSSAIRGDARGVHYSASKAGVLGMTRAMALALAPHISLDSEGGCAPLPNLPPKTDCAGGARARGGRAVRGVDATRCYRDGLLA